MTVLHQLIAVEPTVKSRAEKDLTASHHDLQKTTLLNGITRTYEPKLDDGDRLPPESTLVQLTVDSVLKDVATRLEHLFDLTLTKEHANATARANIVVDGVTLATDVPVYYLLFLDNKLTDLYTLVSKLPVLDQASSWIKDENNGIYATVPVKTVRTKKMPKNWEKAPATKEHQAQVEIFYEDDIVGTWTKSDLSGAIPLTRRKELCNRVDCLQAAVRYAREEANSLIVKEKKIAAELFTWLFK